MSGIERFVEVAVMTRVFNNGGLQLRSIPTVGPSGILTSYMGAFMFHKHGKEMTQEGYDKVR